MCSQSSTLLICSLKLSLCSFADRQRERAREREKHQYFKTSRDEAQSLFLQHFFVCCNLGLKRSFSAFLISDDVVCQCRLRG